MLGAVVLAVGTTVLSTAVLGHHSTEDGTYATVVRARIGQVHMGAKSTVSVLEAQAVVEAAAAEGGAASVSEDETLARLLSALWNDDELSGSLLAATSAAMPCPSPPAHARTRRQAAPAHRQRRRRLVGFLFIH